MPLSCVPGMETRQTGMSSGNSAIHALLWADAVRHKHRSGIVRSRLMTEVLRLRDLSYEIGECSGFAFRLPGFAAVELLEHVGHVVSQGTHGLHTFSIL